MQTKHALSMKHAYTRLGEFGEVCFLCRVVFHQITWSFWEADIQLIEIFLYYFPWKQPQ